MLYEAATVDLKDVNMIQVHSILMHIILKLLIIAEI